MPYVDFGKVLEYLIASLIALGIALALFFWGVHVAFSTPVSYTWDRGDMNRTVDTTNVLVNAGCSGTIIDAQKSVILTANHCVENQYEIIEREKISDEGVVTKEKVRRLRDGTISRLTFSGSESVTETKYKVRLLVVDREKDLALVQSKDPIPARFAARFSCQEPARGDHVYIVGNPMALLYASVGVGVVASLQRDYGLLGVHNTDERQSLMQISGGVVGGNSGGAVYNMNGEFVGVPVLAHRVNEVLGFAVPLPLVRKFLVDNKFEYLFAHCEQTP